MTEIFVNELSKTDKKLNGYAVLNHTVLDDLKLMYDKIHLDNIFETAITQGNRSGYFFDSYYQYVIFVQFSIKQGYGFQGAISFLNCFGDVDVALDEYNEYKIKGWELEDRERFMKCFQKAASSTEKATLKIKDKLQDHP